MVQTQIRLVTKGDPRFEDALDKQYGLQYDTDGRVIRGSAWLRLFHPDTYQEKLNLWTANQKQEVRNG